MLEGKKPALRKRIARLCHRIKADRQKGKKPFIGNADIAIRPIRAYGAPIHLVDQGVP